MIEKKFLEKLKEDKHGTIVPVHVAPGSKEFAVLGWNEWKASLVVRLSEKAEKGKANKELLQGLKRLFNEEVEIVRGEKSREKVLRVKAAKPQLLEKLSRI